MSIETKIIALCTQLAYDLRAQDNGGSLEVHFDFLVNLSDNAKPKLTIKVEHYSGYKWEHTTEVKAVEFKEACEELKRRIRRDTTLRAIADQRERTEDEA